MQDVQWAEYDAKNEPVGHKSLLDLQTVCEGFPELSFDEVASKFHNKEEKVLKAAYAAARGVKEQLLNGNPAPEWLPPSNVTHVKKRRVTTFFEVGFVTESEVQNLTGHSSKDLKLGKPSQLELEDGTGSLSGWFIRLTGLSASEIAAMRRVRIESTVGVDLHELLLMHSKQIHQEEGTKMFSFLSNVQTDARPSAFKSQGRHHTPCLEVLAKQASATQQDCLVVHSVFSCIDDLLWNRLNFERWMTMTRLMFVTDNADFY